MKQLAILLAFLLAVLLMMTGVMAVGNARQSEQMAEQAMQLSSTKAELRKIKKEKASLAEALEKSRSGAELLLRERQAVTRRLANSLSLLEAAEGGRKETAPGMTELLPGDGSGELLLQAAALEQALGQQAQAAMAVRAAQREQKQTAAVQAEQVSPKTAAAQEPAAAAVQPAAAPAQEQPARQPEHSGGAICWAVAAADSSKAEADGTAAIAGGDPGSGSAYAAPEESPQPAAPKQASPAGGNGGDAPSGTHRESPAEETFPPAAVLAVSEAIEIPIEAKPESKLVMLLETLREQAARMEQLLGRLAELAQGLTAPMAAPAK